VPFIQRFEPTIFNPVSSFGYFGGTVGYWLRHQSIAPVLMAQGTLIWAILGNARRELWHIRQCRERRICNLRTLKTLSRFDPHLRHHCSSPIFHQLTTSIFSCTSGVPFVEASASASRLQLRITSSSNCSCLAFTQGA
jgi:hypothetical protein